MAEETKNGGSGWLAFIVGGLVVVVAAFGYMAYSGNGPFQTANHNLDIKIEAPNLPKMPAPELPTAPPQNTPTQQ